MMTMSPPDHFAGKKVTVMGLGLFGGQISVVKYLAHHGADIIVTDLATPDRLKPALEELKGVENVTYHLGGHIESDFTDVDLIVVSPAVPKNSRYLKLAKSNNIPVTTEMNLFLDRCPAKTIGITGTVGKSTTVSMIDSVLNQAKKTGELRKLGIRKYWFGGNIGRSLLLDLPKIREKDLVLLELSSFQLEDFPAIEYSPNIAVVINIYPNHLDRHGKLENYIDAKANITRYQQPGDILIVNNDDENCGYISEFAPDYVKKLKFGTCKVDDVFVMLDGNTYILYRTGKRGDWDILLKADELKVPGGHNLLNALASSAVGLAIGISPATIASGLKKFKGIEDRLELVTSSRGVKWYNDSKSTTPQAGIVALRSFESGKIIAIVGGYDKGLDLTDFARELARRTAYTLAIGQTGRSLANKVKNFGGQAEYFGTLEEAVIRANQLAQPSYAVLLSPGCASWDMFNNYQERGREFKKLVKNITKKKRKKSTSCSEVFS